MNLNDLIRKAQVELGNRLKQKVVEKVAPILVPKESPVGAFNKAIVALVMSALIIIETLTGINIGLTEGTLVTILSVLTPVLVWLIPNYPKD